MTATGPPVAITVVGADGCHYCADAHAALAELAAEFPLMVADVDAGTPAGAALLRGHGAGMLPLVLLDGTRFSVGRLPRRKLRAVLAERHTAAVS